MSIYGRTIACLRHRPLGTAEVFSLIYILGELPGHGTVTAFGAIWLVSTLCLMSLRQMLFGERMHFLSVSWRMMAALGLVVLPPLMVSAGIVAILPWEEPITLGFAALVILVFCHLGWTALFGTALLSAARDEPLGIRRSLAEARFAAWPTVKALVLGPVLSSIPALFALGFLSLGLDALEVREGLQEVIFALVGDGMILGGIVLTMAALVSAWEVQVAPPSSAGVFA